MLFVMMRAVGIPTMLRIFLFSLFLVVTTNEVLGLVLGVHAFDLTASDLVWNDASNEATIGFTQNTVTTDSPNVGEILIEFPVGFQHSIAAQGAMTVARDGTSPGMTLETGTWLDFATSNSALKVSLAVPPGLANTGEHTFKFPVTTIPASVPADNNWQVTLCAEAGNCVDNTNSTGALLHTFSVNGDAVFATTTTTTSTSTMLNTTTTSTTGAPTTSQGGYVMEVEEEKKEEVDECMWVNITQADILWWSFGEQMRATIYGWNTPAWWNPNNPAGSIDPNAAAAAAPVAGSIGIATTSNAPTALNSTQQAAANAAAAQAAALAAAQASIVEELPSDDVILSNRFYRPEKIFQFMWLETTMQQARNYSKPPLMPVLDPLFSVTREDANTSGKPWEFPTDQYRCDPSRLECHSCVNISGIAKINVFAYSILT